MKKAKATTEGLISEAMTRIEMKERPIPMAEERDTAQWYTVNSGMEEIRAALKPFPVFRYGSLVSWRELPQPAKDALRRELYRIRAIGEASERAAGRDPHTGETLADNFIPSPPVAHSLDNFLPLDAICIVCSNASKPLEPGFNTCKGCTTEQDRIDAAEATKEEMATSGLTLADLSEGPLFRQHLPPCNFLKAAKDQGPCNCEAIAVAFFFAKESIQGTYTLTIQIGGKDGVNDQKELALAIHNAASSIDLGESFDTEDAMGETVYYSGRRVGKAVTDCVIK